MVIILHHGVEKLYRREIGPDIQDLFGFFRNRQDRFIVCSFFIHFQCFTYNFHLLVSEIHHLGKNRIVESVRFKALGLSLGARSPWWRATYRMPML